MRVHWTDRARARLRLIAEHIREQRPMAVEATITRIVERSWRLEGLPHSGRIVPEYAQPDLREVLEGPYRIIYRVGSDRIDVITVMRYRELLPDDLDRLSRNFLRLHRRVTGSAGRTGEDDASRVTGGPDGSAAGISRSRRSALIGESSATCARIARRSARACGSHRSFIQTTGPARRAASRCR